MYTGVIWLSTPCSTLPVYNRFDTAQTSLDTETKRKKIKSSADSCAFKCPHISNFSSLRHCHLLLDLGDGQAGVQTLGARTGAVEDGVATVQAHVVLQVGAALGRALVS